MSNSDTVSLDGGLKVFVQGFTNAGFNQTVTITPPSSQGAAVVFTGHGEGNMPMQLTTQGFLTAGSGGKWPSFTTPGNPSQNVVYKITCSNSGPNTSDVEVNSSTYPTPRLLDGRRFRGRAR